MSRAAEALPVPPGTGDSMALRAIERISGPLTRRSVVPVALVLTLLLGVGDRVTGVELPFTILYALPIALGTWFRDRVFGLLVSALATACISASLVHDSFATFGIAWNLGGAMVLFVAATWGVDQLHAYVQRERAERMLAVEQLRHAERLNVIGTLAAGVAHELGTPLNVIAGCAEILAEDSTASSVHRRTTMILDQVSRMSAIIRHLLDFGHRGGLAREDVDLNTVAAGAIEMLQSTARKRNASLRLEVGSPVHVNGNVAELEQVLSNLILNALQAIGERGQVRVETGVEQRPSGPAAFVVVEDDGRGIAPEDLPRIFDPFFTTKGVGEGTGLGLSVSYGIIRDHEGAIQVSSERGRGTRFTVMLPLRE